MKKQIELIVGFLPIIAFSLLAKVLPSGDIGTAALVCRLAGRRRNADEQTSVATEDPKCLLLHIVCRSGHPRLQYGQGGRLMASDLDRCRNGDA